MVNLKDVQAYLAGCDMRLLFHVNIKNNIMYILDENKQEYIVSILNNTKMFSTCSWDKDTHAIIFK